MNSMYKSTQYQVSYWRIGSDPIITYTGSNKELALQSYNHIVSVLENDSNYMYSIDERFVTNWMSISHTIK